MPGTTPEISKLHCQPFRHPLVETCRSVDGRTQDKDWKTNKQMGCANTNVLPIENREEESAKAKENWSFDTEVLRVEITFAVAVLFLLTGLPSEKQVQFDSIYPWFLFSAVWSVVSVPLRAHIRMSALRALMFVCRRCCCHVFTAFFFVRLLMLMYFAGDFSMTTFQLHRASPVLCPMAYNFVSAEVGVRCCGWR